MSLHLVVSVSNAVSRQSGLGLSLPGTEKAKMPLCLSENVMMHYIMCERASPPTYTWSEAFESFFLSSRAYHTVSLPACPSPVGTGKENMMDPIRFLGPPSWCWKVPTSW